MRSNEHRSYARSGYQPTPYMRNHIIAPDFDDVCWDDLIPRSADIGDRWENDLPISEEFERRPRRPDSYRFRPD